MPTASVYSPFSGQVIGSSCYCYRRTYDPCNPNLSCPGSPSPYCKDKTTCTSCTTCFCSKCCSHIIVGSGTSQPLDIAAPADLWIWAWLSSNIGSVKIIHMSGVCSSATGDINLGTYLEAYTGLNAGGTMLGRVLYAHVKNRQHANNQIINKSEILSWSVVIGQVPPVPSGQTCYQSTHTHFQGSAGPGVTVARTGAGCGANLSAANSAIYTWTY